jgi:hypothetical protein
MKENGESERWRRSSAGCERVQALAAEKRAKMLAGEKSGRMLGEHDREKKPHDT